MRELFPGNYKLDIEETKATWKDCIFIFDTNVLLSLYRLAKPEREEVLQLIGLIQDRIWIPHQVALEYQMNRLNFVYDRIDTYDKVATTIGNARGSIENALRQERIEDLAVKQQAEEVSKHCNALIDRLREQKTAEEEVLIGDEALRNQIDALFKDRIGPPPTEQAWLDEVYKQGKLRQTFKIPPAFMDKEKAGKAYGWRGLRFEREYGDLILWQQLIDFAEGNKLKNVILVTDDRKDDWWTIIKGKTIGPRPELVSELFARTSVERFMMYSSVQFYEHARTDIGATIKPASIEKIREAIAPRALEPMSTATPAIAEDLFPGRWELEYILRGAIGHDTNVEVRNGNQYYSNGQLYFTLENVAIDISQNKLYFTKRRANRDAPVAVNKLDIIELGKCYEGVEDIDTPVRYYRIDPIIEGNEASSLKAEDATGQIGDWLTADHIRKLTSGVLIFHKVFGKGQITRLGPYSDARKGRQVEIAFESGRNHTIFLNNRLGNYYEWVPNP